MSTTTAETSAPVAGRAAAETPAAGSAGAANAGRWRASPPTAS